MFWRKWQTIFIAENGMIWFEVGRYQFFSRKEKYVLSKNFKSLFECKEWKKYFFINYSLLQPTRGTLLKNALVYLQTRLLDISLTSCNFSTGILWSDFVKNTWWLKMSPSEFVKVASRFQKIEVFRIIGIIQNEISSNNSVTVVNHS